jgi:hypothetical protein
MSTSIQAAAQPQIARSTIAEPGDEQHRCGRCGGRVRTVALLCSNRECRDVILDDMTASEVALLSEAARTHTCPHCGASGEPIEMIECSGCSNPVRVDVAADAPTVASGPAVGAIVDSDEEKPNGSATVDERATSRAPATAAEGSEQSNILLKLAPEYFKLAVTASGVSAVLAGEIDREELYLAEGFSSFREYAETKLGISSDSAFKKLRQAARTVWEFYPDLAAAVLRTLQVDGHARVHDLPDVPDETKLYLLKRAHKNAPEDERPHLLERALNGTCTTRQLEEMARRGRTAKLSRRSAQYGKRGDTATPTSERTQTAPETAPTPLTHGKEPAARSAAALSVAPTAHGSAEALQPQPEDLLAANGSVNAEALLSRALSGLDEARDALSRLAPGEIKADRLSSLRELLFKVQHALEAHKEE